MKTTDPVLVFLRREAKRKSSTLHGVTIDLQEYHGFSVSGGHAPILAARLGLQVEGQPHAVLLVRDGDCYRIGLPVDTTVEGRPAALFSPEDAWSASDAARGMGFRMVFLLQGEASTVEAAKGRRGALVDLVTGNPLLSDPLPPA